jgi:hypothetical protein
MRTITSSYSSGKAIRKREEWHVLDKMLMFMRSRTLVVAPEIMLLSNEE